jgi:hypothetical protein
MLLVEWNRTERKCLWDKCLADVFGAAPAGNRKERTELVAASPS